VLVGVLGMAYALPMPQLSAQGPRAKAPPWELSHSVPTDSLLVPRGERRAIVETLRPAVATQESWGNHAGVGALIGAGVGVVIGVIYGLTYRESEDSGSPAARAAIAGFFYGLGGAAIGLFVGSLIPRGEETRAYAGVRVSW